MLSFYAIVSNSEVAMGPDYALSISPAQFAELLRSLGVQGVPPAAPSPTPPAAPTVMLATPTMTEEVKVQILPDGRMSPKNAARYLGREEKTLAQWRSQGKGPKYVKLNGRVFYFRDDLDAEIAKCRA
jgi:hypothetical protein